MTPYLSHSELMEDVFSLIMIEQILMAMFPRA